MSVEGTVARSLQKLRARPLVVEDAEDALHDLAQLQMTRKLLKV